MKLKLLTSKANVTELINHNNGIIETKLTIAENYLSQVIGTVASGQMNDDALKELLKRFPGISFTSGVGLAGVSVSVQYDYKTSQTKINVKGSIFGVGVDSKIVLDENFKTLSQDTDFGFQVIVGLKGNVAGLISIGTEAQLQLGLNFKDGQVSVNSEAQASIGLILGEIDASASIPVETIDINGIWDDLNISGGADKLGGGVTNDTLDYVGKLFTRDGSGPDEKYSENQQELSDRGKNIAQAKVKERYEGRVSEERSKLQGYGRDTAVSEQIDVLSDPSKAANAGGLVGKVSPGLSSPLESPERLFGERRSDVGQSSGVPRYQASMDELTTSKPTPRERSYPWPDKPIRNIADAGAFIFEILNSPTPAQLRKKQKPVVYPKFPTSHQGGGEAGDETEALMRLMMPAKKKNQTPFPVPLEEIARVLLQPRP